MALAAAVTAMLIAPGGADAFWASHGSYGSGGSYGSYGSRGSSGGSFGSYGSRGSYGSYGSYGSSGGSSGSHGSYGSSGGSSGSHGSYGSHGPGPFKRLAAHIRAKRASRGSSGGSSASYGSHGSSASHGSSGATVTYYHSSAGSHGSSASHGSTGSHGSYGGSYSSVTTSHSHVVASTPVAPSAPVATGSGMLRVSVPADAVVYVNDNKTTSTGSQRQYVSNGLKEGQSYTYRVRVEYQEEGKVVSNTKTVRLTAGSDQTLEFGSPAAVVADADETEADSESTVTKLSLRVPADAEVRLAGALTKQTGEQREFLTTRLEAGATWEDYTVSVKVEVDGEPVVQERTITLRGGESQAMVFNFDAPVVASLN